VELPFRSTFSFSGKYSGSESGRSRVLRKYQRTLKIFLILFSTLSYLQNNSDFDVFKKIIEHESGTGVLGLYVHENLKLL
jgi:hypothetical protein